MKITIYTIFLLSFFSLSSCKNSEADNTKNVPEVAALPTLENGKILFDYSNCAACHQVNEKVVGPSLETIAAVYKEKNGDLKAFLLEVAQPIVNPEQYESMRINLQITKAMSDSDLESLVLYLQSYEK